MATNVGLKLGIDGEAQFRSALQNIAQQAKTLDSEMKAVTSSFTSETSAQERATKTSEVLTKQIDVQRQKLEQQTQMLERATQMYGETDTRTLSWKDAVNTTTASLNKMENELKGVNDGVEQTAEEMKDGEQSSLSFGDVLKANVTGQAIIKGVEALASAFKKVATEIVNACKEALAFADDLLTLSVQTGLTTDQLQELEYMSGLLDVDVSTITGSLRKLTNTMDSAASGTGAAFEAFEALGVSVTDDNNNLRDSYDVFLDVIDALGQIDNATQRDAIAMDILGRGAMDLNTLINAGTGAMIEYAQEAHEVGYVMDSETVGALAEAQDSVDRLTARFDSFKRNIVAEFAPEISGALEGVLGLLSGDTSIEDFIAHIQESIPSVVERFTELVGDIGSGIMDNLPQIIEAGVQLVISLATGLIQAIPTLLGKLPEVIYGIVTGLLSAIPQLLIVGKQLLENVILGIIQYIATANAKMKEVGDKIVQGLWNGIKNAYEWIKAKITEWVGNVLDFIKQLFGINSPSKVTTEYGVMLDLGLANGLLKGTSSISKAWEKATSGIGAIDTTIAASTGSISGTRSGSVVTFNITQRQGEDSYALAQRINRQLGRIYG